MKYRFASYGEKYVVFDREPEFMNLEIIAPNYRAKRVFAHNLQETANKENYLADHTQLLDLMPNVERPVLSQTRIKQSEDSLTMIVQSGDTMFTAGYDNKLHVTTPDEAYSIPLKKTPLCM